MSLEGTHFSIYINIFTQTNSCVESTFITTVIKFAAVENEKSVFMSNGQLLFV